MIKQIYCTLFDIRIRNFSLESKVRCSWSLCANISVGIQLDKNQIPNKVYVTTFIFVLVGFHNTHTHKEREWERDAHSLYWQHTTMEKSLWRAKWETLCKMTTILHCCEDRAFVSFSEFECAHFTNDEIRCHHLLNVASFFLLIFIYCLRWH